MSDFPTRPSDVSPEWLSEVLGQPVGDATWEAIGTGQVGDSARFHLSYSGGEGPATLAGKFPAEDPTSRGTAVMMGLYRKEVSFYRDVAPVLEVRVPDVIFAEVDEAGSEFILLFEDLGPARGGNQLESCSAEDAREAIKQAAAIHAPSWNNAEIIGNPLFQTPPEVTAQLKVLYKQAHALFAERYKDQLEPEFMAVCHDLNALSDTVFEREAGDRCMVHGDFRLDNMLFDIKGGAEPIAILDWQTVTIGNGLTDVGYFLGCGIGDELRRDHEDELLDIYCVEMTRRGVSMARDEIWQDYVVGALSGVSTAVFSAAFVERTERGDANFLSMARGACALALQHDSIGALKEIA